MRQIKKLSALILSIIMLVMMCPAKCFADDTSEFAGGDGTVENPYLVATKEQLNNVRDYLSSNFKMVADIIFTDADFAQGGIFYNDGYGWEPIGTNPKYDGTPDKIFTGVFDGNGHFISGVYMDITREKTQSAYAGIFGFIQGATIKNLTISGGKITVETKSACAGGIVGAAFDSNIVNCFNSASISAFGIYGSSILLDAGGIAGCSYGNGSISKCINIGNIRADTCDYPYTGGIVGSSDVPIKDCFNTGDILAIRFYVAGYCSAGGIAGATNSTIDTCYNLGSIVEDYTNTIYDMCYAFSGTVTNSYCLRSDGKNCTPYQLTSEQMKKKSSYQGFDFNGVWEIDDLIYPYPQLASNRINKISSIKVMSQPSKGIVIEKGKLANLSNTDGEIQITYVDGPILLMNINNQMLSQLDLSKVGTQNIALSYGGVLSEETIPITVYILGDVNGDGDIDNMDIKRLQSHIKGDSKLSFDVIGDINRDGDVDNMDIKRLQAHIKGDLPLQ